jgi:hypothetical protein
MATVRITKELTDQLVRIGNAPFNNQHRTVREGANFDHHAEAVWDALWGEHATTVRRLPDYAFLMKQTLRVRIRTPHDAVDLQLSLSEARPIPHKIPDTDILGTVWGDMILIKDHLHWADLFGEVSAWTAQLAAIDKQRKTFEENLKKLLSTYSTLAPALKAWPPLWDMLPEDVKTKHKEVTKREKKATELGGIDLGTMTAMVTVRKLTGGF